MRTIVLFIALTISTFFANAQNKGKITGKVTDATTKQVIDYATISLYKQGATAPFNGVVTDEKGNFTVQGLATGDYVVKIDFIGYQQKVIAHAVITDAAPTAALGNIFLAPVQNQLQDVVITAKRPTVENKIDKMVYNPQNDLTAQGGMAIDILQKVPQISVDIDGNVELQGNSNIRFLINGKPSSIFGSSLTEALQSIPASQIQSIEVITNPGAKYDATGTGGIINIILKQNNVQGVNGSVNLSAGTRLENGSFNINAKKGNFGVGAFFNGNERINTTTLTNATTKSTDATTGTTTDLLQNGSSAFKRSGYQSGINFQWDVTKKDQLTASFSYNHFGNDNVGTTNQEQLETGVSNDILKDQFSTLNSVSHFHANSSDVSLGYKKTFDKKDEELDFLVSSSLGSNYNYASQQQSYLDGSLPTSGSMSTNPGTDRETDISLDYTYPFSKTFTLETGAKAVIEDISNSVATDTLLNNGGYSPDAGQTYNFNYNRDVFAYYISGTFSLFHDFINGMAGLRYEYTSTSSSYANTNVPGYGILAPSFVLQHKLSDDQSIKFSYSYRLQRPEYSDVDPFYNVSDPHNISTGNPNLKPELGHNFELGYNKSFNNGPSIYLSAFYRYNTNDIQSLTTYYNTYNVNGTDYNDVELTTRSNIGSEINEGANLFISIPVTGKFSLRSNNFFADRISKNPFDPLNPGDPTRVSGFAYRLNLNASYEFAPSFAAEVFGNYRSSQRTIQGTSPAFAFYNFAVRKQLWKKTASIGLTAANPFSNYIKQTATTNTGNSYETSTREVPFRSFGISLTYKFGKLDFKKPAKEDVPDDTTTPNKTPDSGPK
ncbi:outer membrane beta-barrel family protein [Mucilaginibacter sp. L196]|uniref:outer membrane beta-barrel family protein n=1 Tax=Mucilaginibacter sp. L196 TaxID=1641870 RepID=UPI00131C419C|nr:outer membrane beta-barrel family protein [Mucilaginibacter sp. L196]